MTHKKRSENLDWVANPRKFVFAWGIPILALILSGIGFPDFMKVIWPLALAWMGFGCLLNASRCYRRHCFYTGPFFLVLAFFSLLHGWNILSLGIRGWFWMGWVVLSGGLALTVIPEWVWGRYVDSKCS